MTIDITPQQALRIAAALDLYSRIVTGELEMAVQVYHKHNLPVGPELTHSQGAWDVIDAKEFHQLKEFMTGYLPSSNRSISAAPQEAKEAYDMLLEIRRGIADLTEDPQAYPPNHPWRDGAKTTRFGKEPLVHTKS